MGGAGGGALLLAWDMEGLTSLAPRERERHLLAGGMSSAAGLV